MSRGIQVPSIQRPASIKSFLKQYIIFSNSSTFLIFVRQIHRIMDWTNLAFLIPVVSAPVYIIAGLIMLKYPPKRINHAYGYRTPRSVMSQQRWDFAQRYSSRQMIIWGIFMLAFSFLGILVHEKTGIQFLVGMGILFFFTAIPIALTERELKKRFKY